MISIVACCYGAKLCAHAARDFRSQQQFMSQLDANGCIISAHEKKKVVKYFNEFILQFIWTQVTSVFYKFNIGS